jgi:ribonuclease HI
VTEAKPEVIAYTDGGCRGNPGIGAWAFVLINPATGNCLERCGGTRDTTNNRMEMQAAVEALKALSKPGTVVEIRSDSQYLIKCCSEWLPGWKRKGWKKAGGPLKNVDLLQTLDVLLAKHTVTWKWVAAHNGEKGNERVDELANQAMDRIAQGQDPAWEGRRVW